MIKAAKFGRFAFILPYIIAPIVITMQYNEDIKEAFLYAFFLPFGIESPIIILYPVCWIITIASIITCHKSSKETGDKKEKRVNKIITGIIILIVVLIILAVIDFVRNFKIVF